MCVCDIYVYIYIYIYRERERGGVQGQIRMPPWDHSARGSCYVSDIDFQNQIENGKVRKLKKEKKKNKQTINIRINSVMMTVRSQ